MQKNRQTQYTQPFPPVASKMNVTDNLLLCVSDGTHTHTIHKSELKSDGLWQREVTGVTQVEFSTAWREARRELRDVT